MTVSKLHYHFLYINLQVFALDEVVQSMLSEGVIVYPEIAQVIYVLSESAVILSLGHVQISDASIAFLESEHCQFISFQSDTHGSPRYLALLTLVVELAYRRKHLSSVVIFRLLHLRFHDLLSSLCLLHLSFAKAPIEEGNGE